MNFGFNGNSNQSNNNTKGSHIAGLAAKALKAKFPETNDRISEYNQEISEWTTSYTNIDGAIQFQIMASNPKCVPNHERIAFNRAQTAKWRAYVVNTYGTDQQKNAVALNVDDPNVDQKAICSAITKEHKKRQFRFQHDEEFRNANLAAHDGFIWEDKKSKLSAWLVPNDWLEWMSLKYKSLIYNRKKLTLGLGRIHPVFADPEAMCDELISQKKKFNEYIVLHNQRKEAADPVLLELQPAEELTIINEIFVRNNNNKDFLNNSVINKRISDEVNKSGCSGFTDLKAKLGPIKTTIFRLEDKQKWNNSSFVNLVSKPSYDSLFKTRIESFNSNKKGLLAQRTILFGKENNKKRGREDKQKDNYSKKYSNNNNKRRRTNDWNKNQNNNKRKNNTKPNRYNRCIFGEKCRNKKTMKCTKGWHSYGKQACSFGLTCKFVQNGRISDCRYAHSPEERELAKRNQNKGKYQKNDQKIPFYDPSRKQKWNKNGNKNFQTKKKSMQFIKENGVMMMESLNEILQDQGHRPQRKREGNQ